ncbi:hypothetical protein [Methylobacterium aquaticum]|uniref:hypothetical protein n=1 Tax=Methylobacterium aquaticum TaxID=270351 RepID=UPI0019332709|nr:hypothetical protein [Methylobacterium aquaticum]QRE78254.1 hypothetical protein F1D61_33045 [Methylobacterium aquaticum]
MRIISKSAFARLCNVQPSAVSNWIANGILSGEAIVGEGRTARINVDVARVQVNQRRDIGQALGNGLKVRLRPEATAPAPSPVSAEAPTLPNARAARILFFEGALALARELHMAIALVAHDSGATREEARRVEAFAREGVRREIGLLANLFGHEAGVTFADLYDESRYLSTDWKIVDEDECKIESGRADVTQSG